MTPFIAELLGTFLLILMGNGVNANVILKKTYGSGSGWIVITTGWALAVYTGVVVAAPYSGAHLNPAVTLGLVVAGEFPAEQIPTYILAQFIGAMLGAFSVWLMNRNHFEATDTGDDKRAVFCNAPAIPNTFANLLTEILGTFVLIFAVLYFTDAVLSSDNTIIGLGSLGALPVALIVWGIGLSLGGTTGYAINPARDLGPRIVHALLPIKNKGSNGWGYSWIPVLGPLLGAVLAAGLALYLG